jgi:hypothetical protein
MQKDAQVLADSANHVFIGPAETYGFVIARFVCVRVLMLLIAGISAQMKTAPKSVYK